MRDYRNITIWQNVSRRDKLIAFRNDLIDYSRASFEYSNLYGGETKAEKWREVVEYRIRVNRNLREVQQIVSAARIPILIGRYVDDVLERDSVDRPLARTVDFLEQAIGVYQGDITSAINRSFNPLWWLFQLLQWFAHVPFVIIGGAGFNTARVEDSLVGRITKLIFLALPAIAALLWILDFLNYW